MTRLAFETSVPMLLLPAKVIVVPAATLMVTLASAPGTVPLLQFAGLFQSPPCGLIHEMGVSINSCCADGPLTWPPVSVAVAVKLWLPSASTNPGVKLQFPDAL